MPEPPRKPSDTPEAWAERQRRRRHAGEVTPLSDSPVRSKIRSDQVTGVTPRDTAESRVTRRDTTGDRRALTRLGELLPHPSHPIETPLDSTDPEHWLVREGRS
jgi:hypothetical protein